ncbi:High-affnity carbon uptake protein Hat/HatR [Fulvivirga imtechensis AK7]|uniref:High-affnity carbon uptake protein Hat/HatR n=1 Tax=Fulvivirga imtechensis AK7 TaxID=1237149 RepID=L8JM35_9BACT|nr:High-affinity carbon uptake protein Hat/HatR [Fulvivirga imtechensis]ELR69996.1 High-affnity carbon uptake protein Hat/HatR [Fulvivirga imtechensis AK7]
MSDIVDDKLSFSPKATTVEANPFPGLRPFKIEESHLFFGREGQSDEVLLKLSKNRFVGVIGPSGSGKSSFIYCGVLPILYGGFLTDTSPNWEVVVTRPGAGPIENLAESLLQSDGSYLVADGEEKKIKKTIITTLLKSSSLGLVEAIMQSRRAQNKNYLVLVDQFEELFRFKDSADSGTVNETLAFVNLLIEAINYADAPIYVGITMRSDFIGDCAQFPDLTKKINDSHYLIPQMTREQKRRAIEGPVAVGGAEITQRLTQQLLNDLGDNPDQLPILQHALMRTWSYWSKYRDYEEEPVDIKHYEAIGTMSEALSMHANEAYDELTEDQKHICESLFKAITEKRGENFGIRRPTRLGEIAAIADVSEQEVIEVIDKFREPGRSLLTPAFTVDLNSRSMIDISHESLMRIWVRLKNWVDDEAEAVQMYLRLSEAAAMYQVGKAGLWRPPDLQLALNWQAKHKPTLIWGQRYHPAFERTMVFLEYSRKEFETEQRIKELQQKRRLRNARVTALVLASATVISIMFLIYAFIQKAEADSERLRAEANADLAKQNEARANDARKEAEENAEIAKIEQKRAESEKERAESEKDRAETALKDAEEQRQRAETGEALAKQNEKLAIDNQLQAEENALIAAKNEKEALAAKAKADRLRYLAIAKAMAIKSTQFRDEQATLKGLLAQQAYIFNTNNDGDKYDHDIYDGLYEALKSLKNPLVESLGGHDKGIRAVVSTKNGNFIYSSDTQGKILRWNLKNANREADTLISSRADRVIRTIAVSSDNRWLIAGGEFDPNKSKQSFIEVLDLNNIGKGPRQLSGFEGDVWNLQFTPDNKGLIALDKGGRSIKYSDLNTVKEVATSSFRLNDIELSSDGNWIIGAGNNGKVMLYDVRQGYKASEIYDNKTRLWAVAISPVDNIIAIGDESGLIKTFRLFSNEPPKSLIGHISPINDIKFSSDRRFIASASKDKTVRLWNRDNLNAQPITLSDHPTWVWTIAFSPDNEQILAGTQETVVRAWPTKIETMADKICGHLDRNMNQEEWNTYVGDDPDLKYESTCENQPPNN